MLRVRTGPKALRAIEGSSFKLWDIAREKINWPEHTASHLQNKGTEKLQRRASPSPLEVGGRGEGETGKLRPREATPSHTANRPPVSI